MARALQPIDAITLAAQVKEISPLITGAKINRIQQQQYDDLIFTLWHPQHGNTTLYINISAQCNTLLLYPAKQHPNWQPTKIPLQLCTQLRKTLNGATISAISVIDHERIVVIDFKGFSDIGEPTEYQLVIELMGKHSNLILLESSLNLILALAHGVSNEQSRARQLRIGGEYLPPPVQQNRTPVQLATAAILTAALATDAPDQLFSGLSKVLFNQLLLIGKNNPQAILQGIEQISTRPKAAMLLNQHVPVGYTLLANYPPEPEITLKPFATVNEMLCEYYVSALGSQRTQQLAGQLYRLLQKQLDRLADRYEQLKQLLTEDVEALKQQADDTLLKESQGQSVEESSQKQYVKYKKAKTRKQLLLLDEELLCQKMALMTELSCRAEDVTSEEELKLLEQDVEALGLIKKQQAKPDKKAAGKKASKKQTPTSTGIGFNRHTLPEGHLLWVGRNAVQNDALLRDVAKNDDYWLHVQGSMGGHVILRLTHKDADLEAVLKQAAEVAVYYSRRRTEKNVSVIYTQAKHVRTVPAMMPGYVQYEQERPLFVTLPDGYSLP